MRISGNPRFDEDGRFLGYVGVSSDVTARYNWLKMQYARHKREALGQMAGGLAHELNNLLQPVVSLSRRARKRLSAMPQPPEPVLAMLDDIGAAGRAARDVVRGVLTYAGGGVTGQEPVVLSEAVAAAVDTAAGLLGGTVRIDRSIEPFQELAAVTRMDVMQVVVNLMTNAADAAGPEGTVWVSLHIEPPKENASALAVLRVRDNGRASRRTREIESSIRFSPPSPSGKGAGSACRWFTVSFATGVAMCRWSAGRERGRPSRCEYRCKRQRMSHMKRGKRCKQGTWCCEADTVGGGSATCP